MATRTRTIIIRKAKCCNGSSQTQSTSASPYVSVLAYGAVGDGSHDDTIAIQAALTAAGPKGQTVYFPRPVAHYKITVALTILQWHGMTILGEGWETTEIRQYTSNTPIFQITKDLTHSIEWRGLRLTYATVQTYASHPNSVAIARVNSDGVSTLNGIFHLAFRDLKIVGATYGFHVIRSFPGDTTSVNGWWGCEWNRILMGNINRTCIDLNLGNVGAPCNLYNGIKVFQNQTFPNDGAAPCFNLRGEAIMSAIDVEQWHNTVLSMVSAGVVVVNGIHIEHHYCDNNTGGNRTCYFANCAVEMHGLSMSYDSSDSFPKFAVFCDANSDIWLRGPHLEAPIAGGSFVFSGVSNGTAAVRVSGFNVGGSNPGVQLWPAGTGFNSNVKEVEGLPPALLTSGSDTDALPAASVTYRNRQYIIPGNGTTTADRLVQCRLGSNGTYSWVDL